MGALVWLFCSAALADSSEPQDFVMMDEVELFSGIEYDSGWLPADSSIQVRYTIESVGSARVQMEGEATLQWPEAFSLELVGQEGSGVMELDAGLDLVTSVKFDVSGYSWESELDRRDLDFSGLEIFSPFLLAEDEPSVVQVEHQGASTEFVSTEVSVTTGVSLAFDSEISTAARVDYTGVAWALGDDWVDSPNESLRVLVESEPTWVEVEPVLQGEWTAQFDLLVTPSVSVCVDIIGCVELASFDIEIPLSTEVLAQPISAGIIGFGVPRLAVESLVVDLGEVEIGSQSSAQIVLANIGEARLEGSSGILGSADFGVFPTSFGSNAGETDGVVVDFWPLNEGEFEAVLILESNDPYEPILQIVLQGQGAEALDTSGDADEVITASIRTCGCASSQPVGTVWWWAVSILGLGLRRRA